MEPLWNLTSGPPRTTPEPIWAETPKLSAVGKRTEPTKGLLFLYQPLCSFMLGRSILIPTHSHIHKEQRSKTASKPKPTQLKGGTDAKSSEASPRVPKQTDRSLRRAISERPRGPMLVCGKKPSLATREGAKRTGDSRTSKGPTGAGKAVLRKLGGFLRLPVFVGEPQPRTTACVE